MELQHHHSLIFHFCVFVGNIYLWWHCSSTPYTQPFVLHFGFHPELFGLVHGVEFPDGFQKPSVGAERTQQTPPLGLCEAQSATMEEKSFLKKSLTTVIHHIISYALTALSFGKTIVLNTVR